MKDIERRLVFKASLVNSLGEIEKGDLFILLEPDGTPVVEKDTGQVIFRATRKAKAIPMSEGTWSITAKGYVAKKKSRKK